MSPAADTIVHLPWKLRHHCQLILWLSYVKVGGKGFLCSVQKQMPLEIGDERTEVESSVINDSSLNTSTASARPMPEIRATKLTDSSTQ